MGSALAVLCTTRHDPSCSRDAGDAHGNSARSLRRDLRPVVRTSTTQRYCRWLFATNRHRARRPRFRRPRPQASSIPRAARVHRTEGLPSVILRDVEHGLIERGSPHDRAQRTRLRASPPRFGCIGRRPHRPVGAAAAVTSNALAPPSRRRVNFLSCAPSLLAVERSAIYTPWARGD